MEIVIAVASKIAEYTVAPVGRQIGYVIFFNCNIDNIKEELQKLVGAKAGVQHSVDAALRNGEEIEVIVQTWLKKVDEIVAESERSFNVNVGCSNMLLKHQLSRKAKKMIPSVTQILAEGKFDKISFRPTLPVTIPPSSRDYEALGSRTSILYEIKLALKDAGIYKIGVYGMGGVGKTTLVKELAWQVEQEGLFGAVVVASVTSSPDVKKVQGEIADGLGLKFDEETEMGRARRLRDRIRRENNILVIVDDIWRKLDLTEVGIPCGDDHIGCKLLFTSRDLNVLNCEMGTQKEFRLEALSDGESWSLFEKMTGVVVNDISLQPTALKVAKSCAGLPLLIATVAKALKNRELYAWEDALIELTRFGHEGLGSKVYSGIKLSYDYLESDELRRFFLFLASFGNVNHIHDLLIYGWGLGLYKGVNTLADVRNRIYKLTDDLRASCLLLEGERDSIKTHDVIYDVASQIASTIEPFFAVQRYGRLNDWPKMDSLKRFHSISLPWCYIEELPERLECPELKMLVLNSQDNYLKVPDNFFDGMRELKVLDLGGFDCCPSPPQSLSHLTNLRSLYLCQCMLEDITIVTKLTNLEILSLHSSEIKELPQEIGQLTNIRMLDLTSCKGLSVIPANVLSRLTCLEELYMGDCYIKWEVEGRQSQYNNACLGELRQLPKLRILNLQIQDESVLPRDLLFFGKLETYKIVIGHNFQWFDQAYGKNYASSRVLKLNMRMVDNIELNVGIKMLLTSVEELYLSDSRGVGNILYQLNGDGFPQLKHLYIENNNDMQYIIDSTKCAYPRPAFPNLESLDLHNLLNLEEICHGPFPLQSFSKLKAIKVTGCEKLRDLIIYEMVENLSQLVEVEISQCKCVSHVIVEDDKEIDKILLPNLRSLTLDCLPMFASFYSKSSTANMHSRNYGTEYQGSLSIPLVLLDEKVVLPNLESLKVSSISLNTIWNDQIATHSCFQKLTRMTIDNCDNLKYVFSSSVARGFVSLQYLEITRCKMLEEIFYQEESLPSLRQSLWNEEVTFPSLETLVISHMSSLKSIWKSEFAPNSFGKLNKMEIKFCGRLLVLFPSHVHNHLVNLEMLLVSDCDAMKVIFENQEQSTRTTQEGTRAMKLRTLTLENLLVVNHVLPMSLVNQLVELQMLYIVDCGVQNIVAKDETVEAAPRFLFPQLSCLRFWSLRKLESFYPGMHSLDCPKLRILDVYHCYSLQLFTTNSQNCLVNMEKQPLFSFEKVISNLEELSLSCKDVAIICNAQLRDDYFYTVKALRLQCFHKKLDEFPSGFLQKFINLENAKVLCSSFKEIFSRENPDMIRHTEGNLMLKSLTIKGLQKLEYLFKDKSQIQQVLQNLEILSVFNCHALKNVIPSSISLQNLNTLNVRRCAGLVNLVLSSSARSFRNLQTLVVGDCEMIEEIVSNEEGDAGEITFRKLEHLQLSGLSKLTSFCKGRNHNFKFPLLRSIYVLECPMMKSFSEGILSTPMLRSVKVTTKGDVRRWKGDLNTTVKAIYRETNSEED